MAYFLRWTENAEGDLQRATSIHASDWKTAKYDKEEIAEWMNCDIDDVVECDGYWAQKLNGLCGYAIEAETEEEALKELEEANENGIDIYPAGDFHLYEGTLSEQSNLVPDGVLFIPERLIK